MGEIGIHDIVFTFWQYVANEKKLETERKRAEEVEKADKILLEEQEKKAAEEQKEVNANFLVG